MMQDNTSTLGPRRCLDERPRRGIMRDRAADLRLLWETIFVLAVSLGQSAWYSILRMIERLTRGVPMNQQTSTLNSSVTPGRPCSICCINCLTSLSESCQPCWRSSCSPRSSRRDKVSVAL